MRKLLWSIGMIATLALAIFIVSSPGKVSWTSSREVKPASARVKPESTLASARSAP